MGPSVSIAILTFRRPERVVPLLDALAPLSQTRWSLLEILVIDNDCDPAVAALAHEWGRSHGEIPVRYVAESQSGIPNARNRAVASYRGDFLAFIDDDERPDVGWMDALFEGLSAYDADGALGPVNPEYTAPPPDWVVRAGLHDRLTLDDGPITDWRHGRTGNLLVSRRVYEALDFAFDPRLATGEDQDFFRRAMAAGFRFAWWRGAAVIEYVPGHRLTLNFFVRRAFFRGRVSTLWAHKGIAGAMKSLCALGVYLPLLIVSAPFHRVRFIRTLVSASAHAGMLHGMLRPPGGDETYVG